MEYREFGRAEPFLRGVVTVVCALEVVAITTRKIPTVTRICREHPAASAAVLTALAVHFQPLGR